MDHCSFCITSQCHNSSCRYFAVCNVGCDRRTYFLWLPTSSGAFRPFNFNFINRIRSVFSKCTSVSGRSHCICQYNPKTEGCPFQRFRKRQAAPFLTHGFGCNFHITLFNRIPFHSVYGILQLKFSRSCF